MDLMSRAFAAHANTTLVKNAMDFISRTFDNARTILIIITFTTLLAAFAMLCCAIYTMIPLAVLSAISIVIRKSYQSSNHSPASPADIMSSVLCAVRDPSSIRGDICPICKDTFVRPTTTPCRHTYCNTCIRSALAHQDACPLCARRLFTPLADEKTGPLDTTAFLQRLGAACFATALYMGLSVLLQEIGSRTQPNSAVLWVLEILTKVLSALSTTALMDFLFRWCAIQGLPWPQRNALLHGTMLISGLLLSPTDWHESAATTIVLCWIGFVTIFPGPDFVTGVAALWHWWEVVSRPRLEKVLRHVWDGVLQHE